MTSTPFIYFLCPDIDVPWELWNAGLVYWRLRQNQLLFIAQERPGLNKYQKLFASAVRNGPLSVVHPETCNHVSKMRKDLEAVCQKFSQLLDCLSRGRIFKFNIRINLSTIYE